MKKSIQGKNNRSKIAGDRKIYKHDRQNNAEAYKLNPTLVHIYTGEGKGKSSTAAGIVVRASGAGLKTAFFQYFKNPYSSEIKVFRALENVHFYSFASRYYEPVYFSSVDIKQMRTDFKRIWNKTLSIIQRNEYDLIILDEILIAIRDKLIEADYVADFIKKRPPRAELVLTGRFLPDKLVPFADIITEMKKIKHPFPEIKARKGIDF